MKDGSSLHFPLADRFSSGSPIVVRDSASLPGQAAQVLTDEQKAELAWFEMSRQITDAWQSPAQGPLVKDQRPADMDQAAWAGAGPTPVVNPPAGSSQALQDDDPAGAAHAAMVAFLCSQWKRR